MQIKYILMFISLIFLTNCSYTHKSSENVKVDANEYYQNRLSNLYKIAKLDSFIKVYKNDSISIFILQPSRCNMCTPYIVENINDKIKLIENRKIVLFVSDIDTVFNNFFTENDCFKIYINNDFAKRIDLDFVENMQVTLLGSKKIIDYAIIK